MKNNSLNKTISKIIGCLLLLLTACQGNIKYHSYQPINKEGWYRNDTLTYLFNTTIPGESINELQIGIRHLDSYPYKDLWISITPIHPDSTTTLQADSLHLFLADASGNWKGVGIGELKQTTLIQNQPIKSFKTDSIIGFRIIHLMNDEPLTKITDIGLCIKGL